MATTAMKPLSESSTIERQSLCLSGPIPGVAIHAGEPGFKSNLEKYFIKAENNAAERLVDFKEELRKLEGEAFWNHLMEGLTLMCHAQFSFVSKRILVDDHTSAVEMPLLGEVGSCLMGVALYWNDGQDSKEILRDYKYYAWNAPCSYMRHDKVFLCPEGLAPLVSDNPNQLPFECDAYLGIPLFADGKCFAHFGLMWTKEGLEARQSMTWGYTEMLLHSMEDLIANRLILGQGFAKSNTLPKPTAEATQAIQATPRVIPQGAITAAQSLKPYARSLSHELRTPMQGVVGMLDIMHATVQEQITGSSNQAIRTIFQALKDNIETVQDSSKRAIEAADNVVQAYDLNMQIPETPSIDLDLSPHGRNGYFDSRPKMIEGSNIVNPHKRRRSNSDSINHGSPMKYRHLDVKTRGESEFARSPLGRSDNVNQSPSLRHTPNSSPHTESTPFDYPRPSLMTPADSDVLSTPGLRQSNIRDVLPTAIQEALRVGGRPDSAISEPTPLGEKIEVRSRSSNGYASQKTVEWSVDADVPDFVALDERDLTKLITAVFLNALKFTENGFITLRARLSASQRSVLLNVTDTGTGIPADFQPELFKPFAKEDHSITRTKEGLGLGLLVAKGLARRTGGDLTLIKSSTETPDQGTEFEIRIPLDAGDRSSRATTPFRGTPDLVPAKGTNGAYMDVSLSPFPSISPTRQSGPSLPTISKLVSASASASAETRPAIGRRPSAVSRNALSNGSTIDKNLAQKYPLKFLVAEDNKINRKLLVNMLAKFGYKHVHEAYDGREAVRVMEELMRENKKAGVTNGKAALPIDVVLMDLWMPEMDGYEATERILGMHDNGAVPIVLAVSADVTEAAVDRATRTGMQGYMTKPYKLMDLQRLIMEFCALKT